MLVVDPEQPHFAVSGRWHRSRRNADSLQRKSLRLPKAPTFRHQGGVPRADDIEDFPFYCVEITKRQDDSLVMKARFATYSWWKTFLKRFHKCSTIASWLCIIDCIILPILTLVVPLLGDLSIFGQERFQFLHSIGDLTTIFFLLPIGCFSTILNYVMSQRKRPWTALLGAIGLLLVALANAYSIPGVGHLQVFHCFHRGTGHRVLNVVGCFCLLGSNYLSQRHTAPEHRVGGRKNANDIETGCCILHDSLKSTPKIAGTTSRRRYC